MNIGIDTIGINYDSLVKTEAGTDYIYNELIIILSAIQLC